jgi:hypothetical protein
MLSMNSVTFVYSRNPPYGQIPVANYVTARAEVRLAADATLPIYSPYFPSDTEENIRTQISAALPNRRECSVPLHNIVVSGLTRSQLVIRVLAPELCAAPVADVDGAIEHVFGDVPREVVAGATSLRLTDLCHAGFPDGCPSGGRCAPGVCNSGHCLEARGDYVCECWTGRDPANDSVTSFAGVRCELGRRTCAGCGMHAHCSPGGCTCNSAAVADNSTSRCHLRDPCAELHPCAFGSDCLPHQHGVVCICAPGFEGALCQRASAWAAVLGLVLVALPVCLAAAACCPKTSYKKIVTTAEQ